MQDNTFIDTRGHTETITGLAARLRSGALSCVDLAQGTLARIEAANPRLNAFTFIARAAALEQAAIRDAELAAGIDRGPLHGIPVAVKDNIDTADMPTTNGSRFFADNQPLSDARCVENLRRAGAIIIGKTVTSEFALGPTGEFSMQGAARNPHDTARMTGGSSAGSACAVASGLVTCAVGSDTGGSIRIPSAFCGVVGLKPTYGSVSVEGVFPVSKTLDHIGPIARNEKDAAILIAALQGVAVPDSRSDSDVRVGWLDALELIDIDDDISKTVLARVTSVFGDKVCPVLLPKGLLVQARHCVKTILLSQAYHLHQQRLAQHRQLFCAPVAERASHGAGILASEYLEALEGQAVFQSALERLFEQIDVLLLPTTAVTAPKIGDMVVSISGVQHTVNDAASALTAPWNLSGYPALNLPVGSVGAMPVGLQIISRPGTDFWLLDLAARLGLAVR